MSCSIKYLLAILTLSCCHREYPAISSRRHEDRFLGAIELADGKTIHWGEQTLAIKKLKTAGVAYSLGDSALGMADLWCSSEDYDKALALLGTLGDSNSSGFHPARDFAGLTKEELRHRASEVTLQKNQTDAEQAGAGQPATRLESKSEDGQKPQTKSEGRSR
jgi:hypothetical protein